MTDDSSNWMCYSALRSVLAYVSKSLFPSFLLLLSPPAVVKVHVSSEAVRH